MRESVDGCAAVWGGGGEEEMRARNQGLIKGDEK